MMMMMKNPIMLVACTLLFSSLAVLASNSYGPDKCCFEFIANPLPRKRVVSYRYTDNLCPTEGVIFKMRAGAEICANPSAEWAKNIIKSKEDANAEKVNNSESEKSF
ncbi:C-C motif chemokine 5-like [Mastacembelus armatus]|nr:C-C motif chemokine 5-like [Mastacembelus armatus]